MIKRTFSIEKQIMAIVRDYHDLSVKASRVTLSTDDYEKLGYIAFYFCGLVNSYFSLTEMRRAEATITINEAFITNDKKMLEDGLNKLYNDGSKETFLDTESWTVYGIPKDRIPECLCN